jgi:hypothetical protein
MFLKEELMSRFRTVAAASLIMCMGYAGSAFAIFGIGAHYSLDFSVKMDAANEQLRFDNLLLSTEGFGASMPGTWLDQTISPDNIPIYFDRGEMTRTPFGLGMKIYVDIIPFIDCIEIGGGFTAFQYDGSIRYPKSISVGNPAITAPPDSLISLATNPANLITIEYDTLSTNLEDFDGAPPIPGITKTPYAKLDMGLTIRKYIPIPVIDKVLKPYGGLGFDVMFATPVPSSKLVNDALGDKLTGPMSVTDIMGVMQEDAANLVVEKLLSELMTPHFGMNIVVGLMVKPPVVPIGLYIDGKFLIPFGELDEGAGVTGMGFKLNAGLCLHFGKSK